MTEFPSVSSACYNNILIIIKISPLLCDTLHTFYYVYHRRSMSIIYKKIYIINNAFVHVVNALKL